HHDRLPPGRSVGALHLHGRVAALRRPVHARLLRSGAAPAQDVVIVAAGPALHPAEAARRAAAQRAACWLSSPAPDEVAIARDVVAADPVGVVTGSPEELEAAWREERAHWAEGGPAPPAGVPIAAGWLSYDLGRRGPGAPSTMPAWPELEFHFY